MRTISFYHEIKKTIIPILLLFIVPAVNGQTVKQYSIKGGLADSVTRQPVSFATVALRKGTDSILITGTSSDINGHFFLASVPEGNYQLFISAIGYESVSKQLDLLNHVEIETIYLLEKTISLGEIIISSDRMKTESGSGRITYFISSKLSETSQNGNDLLSYIPGIQVDLMKNISLAGNPNVIIMVDGRERDRNYLSQLDAALIDKVEVNNSPDSRNDAGVTGVINIILRKKADSGISGFINSEAPSSGSVTYLFPSYSISYGKRSLNLFTSYTGELAYLDLVETISRTLTESGVKNDFLSIQDVRQKNWSHRFHYGFDYKINERNTVSFYSYYNPWSRELDGNSSFTVSKNDVIESSMKGFKEDNDRNSSSFYSVYFRHNPGKQGSVIDFDFSLFSQRSENCSEIWYGNDLTTALLSNKVSPEQSTATIKIDYTTPLTGKLRFDGGIKTRFSNLRENSIEEFRYNERVFAAYTSFTCDLARFTLKSGIRLEKSTSYLSKMFNNNIISILPDLMLSYKLSERQNIKISLNRTVTRPGLYNLNPYTYNEDPFSERDGNPFLKPEFLRSMSIGLSNSFGKNFVSFQLVSKKRSGAISQYSYIREDGLFKTEVDNLGSIRLNGIQTSASLRLFKILTVSPALNLYYFTTDGNKTAARYHIINRHQFALESGLSAVASFKHNIKASLKFQYNSPDVQVQTSSYCDPLYFISLEKTFFKNYRLGIKSILPFSNSFIYNGSKAEGSDFRLRYEGVVKLNSFPLLFNFRYQFNSGKKVSRIEHDNDNVDPGLKKGF